MSKAFSARHGLLVWPLPLPPPPTPPPPPPKELGATTLSPASAPTEAISSSVSGASSAAAALPERYSLATVSTNASKE